MCKGKCQNRCATIKTPGKVYARDAQRTFLRHPGQYATITINAPSGAGKTQMHQIISEALSAHGVVVSDVRVEPGKFTTEIFDVVAPTPLGSGRVKQLADGGAAIIVGGGESPTYDELIEAGWIEPLTTIEHLVMSGASLSIGLAPDHPERTAQPCEPVKVKIENKTGAPLTVRECALDEAISIIASEVAQQVVADIKSLSPWPQVELGRGKCAEGTASLDGLMAEAGRVCDALNAMENGKADAIAGMLNKASDNAQRELFKLIQKVGIENWTRGDFVVLPLERAKGIADNIDPRGVGSGQIAMLNHLINKATE